MAKTKINKKALYEFLLKQSINEERYEDSAKISKIIETIKDDEIIEVDLENEKNDEEECV